MKFFQRSREEAVSMVLRFSLGSVFLWFGIDKWIRPDAWFGWVPDWFWPMQPFSPEVFMYLNGAFEFVVGAALIAAIQVRWAAALAGLFLLAISLTVGASEITVRDNALIGIALALFIDADAKAKKPLPPEVLRWTLAAFVFCLFVYGVYYLRA